MTFEIKDLRKSYKGVDALKKLDFELPEGGSVALLGPNGAGKSTAIKTLVSLITPDGGAFLHKGDNLFEKPARIRDLLGYVSQELALDKQMTGYEFMRFTAGIMHMPWKSTQDKALGLLDQMGLTEAKDRLVGEYSGGMKRRLDLACALLHDPKILVLDEPTTGLDIEARETIWGLIKKFMANGGSLILASHDFREVGELSKSVLILDQGTVLKRGTPEALKQDLGRFIIRLKTHEFMSAANHKQLSPHLQNWNDCVLYNWDEEEACTTLIYRGQENMNVLQSKLYERLEQADMPVHALNLHLPDLEDVYRFATGGRSHD